jgi:protein SCO1/2
MLKLSACFLFSLFMLMACNNSSNSISNVKTDSLVPLPFFNVPDWTPAWINKEDSGYAKIHSIPAFSFKDQEGVDITEANVEGKIYVANFFYTKCRGICPKMTTNMSLLQEAFKNDSTILLLSHSVTPEIDSIAVLKKYAILNKVDSKKWHLLTGDKNEIYALAKQQYFAGDSVGFYQTGNEFLHTENFILVDQKRHVRGIYDGTKEEDVNHLIEDMTLLLKE